MILKKDKSLHPELKSQDLLFDVLGKKMVSLRRYRVLRNIVKIINSSEILRVYKRKKYANSYYRHNLKLIKQWASQKNENFNFYYDITKKNRLELISAISFLTNKSIIETQNFFTEINENVEILHRLNKKFRSLKNHSDINIFFGRREAWYVIIRLLKPRLVVESGIYHGIGGLACSLALAKNREEGYQGEYIGIDIDESAGTLLKEFFSPQDQFMYADSLKALKQIEKPIDLFIHDSDHNPDFERKELEILIKNHKNIPVILSDNSHISEELAQFSIFNSRKFLFLREEPKSHWYPGGGVGISIK